MKGISEQRDLWASNANYLNDASELAYGTDAIEKERGSYAALKQVGPGPYFTSGTLAESPYIVSLTSAFDSLGQWRGYAGATPSFAIAFDQKRLM